MFRPKSSPVKDEGFRDAEPKQANDDKAETSAVPKAKGKGKKEAAAKEAADKGHNSGAIPAVDEAFVRILTYDAQIKSINAAKKEERNKLKTEYGLLSDTVAIELKLRKKSPEVRAQIEANVDDLQVMLGRKAASEPEYADPSRKIRLESIQREG